MNLNQLTYRAMLSLTLGFACYVLASVTAQTPAQAADEATEQAADSKKVDVLKVTEAVAVDQKKIDQWVSDLDSDDFQTREQATTDLSKAGATAVPAVEKATLSDSFEQSSRAMRILTLMAKSKDEATMVASNAALARLSTNTNKSVAKAAANAIESTKPKTPKQDPNNRIIQLPGGGQIQLRIQGGGGIIQGIQGVPGANVQATSISKSNINGVETTEVNEASGRKIKIEKNKTIKITVTEKGKDKNGKDQIKTFEADDEAALKKKHAEAHKIYEKYGKGNGMPNLRAFAIRGANIQNLPAGFPNQAQRIPNRRAMQKGITDAQANLEAMAKQLEAAKKADDKTDLDALRSQLEEAIKSLKKAQGK